MAHCQHDSAQVQYRKIKISMSGDQGQLDVQCLVCTRPFTLDTEVTDSFEALAICRECKITVLSDNNRDNTTSTYRERRRGRPRSRATRHGPVEDTFSQQFSQLINLARQGHEADIDSPTVVRQQASYTSTPNRSQDGTLQMMRVVVSIMSIRYSVKLNQLSVLVTMVVIRMLLLITTL